MLGLILHYNTVYVSKGRFQYGIYPLWALTYTNGAYEPDFLSGGALP